MPFEWAVDPNIVYIVLLVGLWSIVTAVYTPGTGFVETGALVANIAAIVMLASMPTNWIAVLLIVVGMAGFLLVPFLDVRLALMSVVGLILQTVGSLFLFNGVSVSLPIIGLTVVMALIYHRFALMPALAHQRKQTYTEPDSTLIGAKGRVVKALDLTGTVQAAGELWTARSEQPVEAGSEVVVVDREGLVLVVESVKHKREEMVS